MLPGLLNCGKSGARRELRWQDVHLITRSAGLGFASSADAESLYRVGSDI